MNSKFKKMILVLVFSFGILATFPMPSHAATATQSSSTANQVIQFGLRYLGTPYAFGSNRYTTTTFDCSDFVRYTYKQVTGIVLPMDSRKQATYVKRYGHNLTTKWTKLKAGDIMFFTSPSTGKVYHVGLYMGNGKILHTYSVKSGGVRVDKIDGTWLERRFYFGGSLL